MKAAYPGLALVLVTCACTRGDASAVPVSVRDSAGVQIVENPGDDAALPQWSLGPPWVSIGVLEGEPAYQLDRVTAARMHGDEIVVLNGGSQELRFFDLEGRHVRTAGRKGEGPGEFASAAWLAPLPGDSIAVYDQRTRRLSTLDDDGRFARAVTPEFPFGTMVGSLSDGSFIVRPGVSVSSSDDIQLGLQRLSISVLRIGPEGHVLDTLGIYPGTEMILEGDMSGARRWFGIRYRPFGLSTQVAAGDSAVYVGTSEAWVIDVLDLQGTLRRSIRRASPPAPLTPDVIDRYRSAQVAGAPDADARREAERYYAAVDFPDRMPAYGAFRVDRAGNLWVQDYVVSQEDSLRWTVFDRSGRIVSRAVMPPRMAVYEIGTDLVLGRLQDELDVERVVLLPIVREAGAKKADRD